MKNDKLKKQPRIRYIANLWTMWDYPTEKTDWPVEKKLVAIKQAGFDGITNIMDPVLGALAQKHGLCSIGYFASAKPSEFKSLIKQNKDGGALRINVQLGAHDTPVEAAVKMAIRLVEEGERQGIPCDIETHRNTCTETPEKTAGLAEGFYKATGRLLPMTVDLSHPGVVKHLEPPYGPRLLTHPKLVRNARQFHLRPFNGHHCQVPVTDGTGKLSVEVRQWLPFMQEIIRTWLTGRPVGEDVFVCPEMGPVRGGYNLAQLPNSWEDAKVLRGLIHKAWKKELAAAKL